MSGTSSGFEERSRGERRGIVHYSILVIYRKAGARPGCFRTFTRGRRKMVMCSVRIGKLKHKAGSIIRGTVSLGGGGGCSHI